MPVGEGGRALSGGQRQAVAGARAFLSATPILLLDEPTSAMDFATERAYVDSVRRVAEGRTLILITHKPTMLSLVDRIIVVEGGKVAADGPRDKVLQLLAGGPKPPAAVPAQQP
jgi:ATP-binding cassette subfamily C protein LapB